MDWILVVCHLWISRCWQWCSWAGWKLAGAALNLGVMHQYAVLMPTVVKFDSCESTGCAGCAGWVLVLPSVVKKLRIHRCWQWRLFGWLGVGLCRLWWRLIFVDPHMLKLTLVPTAVEFDYRGVGCAGLVLLCCPRCYCVRLMLVSLKICVEK